MQAPSQQITAAALRARLDDGGLAGDWSLDQRRSSIRLKNKTMGLLAVKGVFRDLSGHGTVSADGTVTGTITVAAASVDTRNTRRDTHLRSAEIFDSADHPDITFTADGIRPSSRGVTVTGALTVRGHTQPLSFEAVASNPGDGEVWLDAAARIDRTEFGLTWKGDGIASKTCSLTIHAVFTRR